MASAFRLLTLIYVSRQHTKAKSSVIDSDWMFTVVLGGGGNGYEVF